MGYTVHGNTCKMQMDAWETYLKLCSVMFERVLADRGIVLTSSSSHGPFSGCLKGVPTVYFNGSTQTETPGEPFFVSADMCGPMFTKTFEHPYDFAVKCAMVLLAEAGGMDHLSDDNEDYMDWFKAIDWLAAQPGLPDEYPRATYLVHQLMCSAEDVSELTVMQSVLRRSDHKFAAWALSNGVGGWQKFRAMGLRIVSRLRLRCLHRRFRTRISVPRIVAVLVGMMSSPIPIIVVTDRHECSEDTQTFCSGF